MKISKAFPQRELKLEKFFFFFLFTREIVNLRVSPERIFTRFILRTVSIIPPLNVFLASTPRLLRYKEIVSTEFSNFSFTINDKTSHKQ